MYQCSREDASSIAVGAEMSHNFRCTSIFDMEHGVMVSVALVASMCRFAIGCLMSRTHAVEATLFVQNEVSATVDVHVVEFGAPEEKM